LDTQPDSNQSDAFRLWFRQHYVFVILGLLIIYLGAAFMAPLLMRLNLTPYAKWIYTLYSNSCHQLAYRSWFLFGQQSAYPRELANITTLLTYEQVFGFPASDYDAARAIIGNELVGYKVALCQRDVAMYISLILFGLIFALTKKRIRAISFWVWLVIGIVPLGLDGISQLSASGWTLLNSLPLRESTPLIRSFTGFTFGYCSGWFLFPTIERSFIDLEKLKESEEINHGYSPTK